jgi:hypothetical protein
MGGRPYRRGVVVEEEEEEGEGSTSRSEETLPFRAGAAAGGVADVDAAAGVERAGGE